MKLEEYNIKIEELRKLRDFHRAEQDRFDREMNELQIDEQYNNVLKGEYICVSYLPAGYKYYFHVDTWKKRSRGIYITGIGFSLGKNEIRFCETLSIVYEDVKRYGKDYLKIITKEEYYKALEESIKIFRKRFD